ncbi:hypothetical protein ES703_80932 [subsurface metagenome]
MEAESKKRNNLQKEKEIRFIRDVPKSFFEQCYKAAESEEQKKEIKEILKKYE